MHRIARTSLPAIALLLAAVARADPGVAQLAPAAGAAALGAPDLKLRYELLPQADQGRALLRGELDAGATRLRTQVHIDPAEADGFMDRMDLSLEAPAPGPLQKVTLGDGYTSGAGWSAPSRMTGLRIGRSLAVRAPLRADPLALPASFTAAGLSAGPSCLAAAVPATLAWSGRGCDEARGLDAAPQLAPAAPLPGDPVHLDAGATDYEIEAGRLREGWDTAGRKYLADYGAAAYRAGLGFGLTGEARAERSGTQSAQGVELLQSLPGGASLQALAAQSEADGLVGRRRGLALAGATESMTWRLVYTTADRDFRSATGGAEAREGIRLETRYRLNARVTAEAAVARRTGWDSLAPESTLALGADVSVARHVHLRLDLARRASIDPGWRAGVTVAVPVE